MHFKHLIANAYMLLLTVTAGAQLSSVRDGLMRIIKDKKATIGIAVCDLEHGDTLTIHNQFRYPMQSTFKFHLALAVLHDVDQQKHTLEEPIWIPKAALYADTWSPLQKQFPEGNVRLPLAELLRYTISMSDNNACDILFRIAGGTTQVDHYIRSLGITDFAIAANEKQMRQSWKVQYQNWTTPLATLTLLRKVYEKGSKVLSDSSFRHLDTWMTESENAGDRIKGKLPPSTKVAHKTGTSDKNKEGVRAATNDIGIITMPDGRRFAIAVFVSDSREDDATNAAIIADITRLVYDYFSH